MAIATNQAWNPDSSSEWIDTGGEWDTIDIPMPIGIATLGGPGVHCCQEPLS